MLKYRIWPQKANAWVFLVQITPKELKKAGISGGVLRLSIGREDPRDLIADLAQALEQV